MTWQEYEYAVSGYQRRQAREWERTRQICVQMYNLLADKPLTPREYMPLETDSEAPAGVVTPAKESQQEFLARMTANNFYQVLEGKNDGHM